MRIMSNVHFKCENYIATYDMYLCYFELGYHNISQYKDCVEKQIYGEKNGQE